MNRRRFRALVLLGLWGALCPRFGARQNATTFDRNHDGRVDVWENSAGSFNEITRIAEDTNFDGRPDRFSYYEDGALVREELDSNFDGRVDQIERFDVQGEPVRTIRDVDFDGIADLLVLYREGVPIYSQPTSANQLTARPSSRGSDGSLIDPFRNETGVQRVNRAIDPLRGVAARPEPYTLPPSRASPLLRRTLLASDVLTPGLPVDSRHTRVRGPPA